ncbi:lipoyl synthase [Candidatus Poribacteria bacterium]|nr:lipoyl synthase [Candidatus Poribacteria bacterium]
MTKLLPLIHSKANPNPEKNLYKRRHPPWIKAKISNGPNYRDLKQLMRGLNLHTVCEEAQCPNIGECWNDRSATFMILGDVCTRRCMYCAVTKGNPIETDYDEPRRIGEAVEYLKLKHVVITSVNRDDLPDGGAKIFSECIIESRLRSPNCTVEVLIPDLEGNWKALKAIVEARPDVLNHNTETVPRIYRRIRPRADYKRTLELLRLSKEMAPEMLTKSGLMVGLGENTIELLETIQDIRNTNCDLLTIGQYLSPSKKHFDVDYYYTPEEFEQLKTASLKMGFRHVESGPLVRSSYHARQQAQL